MDTIGPKKSLVDQTYEILLDAICTGELVPGERLTQDQIAARLNVSRQPVNSAISILKANHFVEDTGRRGVVAWVERPGVLELGQSLTLHIPDQRAWEFLRDA